MKRVHRRTVAIGLAFLIVLIVAATAGAGIVQEGVLTSTADETQPAGATGYLAWTQNPHSSGWPNVWVRPEGEAKFRVNPDGKPARTYGGGIDGTRLAYSQWASGRARNGDVKIYDLENRTVANPPSGVNTRKNECCTHMSGNWLMFERIDYATGVRQIFLYNLANGRKRKLDESRGSAHIQTGSVEGNWAAWVRCAGPRHCAVHRYNIAKAKKVKIPNPFGRSQFAASLTADGTVYYAEARSINCGVGLYLWRQPIGGSRERLVALGRGRDTSTTSPVVNGDGSVTVYYDRYACSTYRSDVYKIEIAP